jgi:uncharacterized membrane protein (UPF0127 family)
VLLALAGGCGGSRAEACGAYRTDETIRIGSSDVDAEVAAKPAAITKGLSGRKCIAADRAMLFSFGRPGVYSFWMKGMRFPIDIVWLDGAHDVVWLERNVSPSTYPMSFLNREDPAQYVLELKAGRSRELGLRIGSHLDFERPR